MVSAANCFFGNGCRHVAAENRHGFVGSDVAAGKVVRQTSNSVLQQITLILIESFSVGNPGRMSAGRCRRRNRNSRVVFSSDDTELAAGIIRAVAVRENIIVIPQGAGGQSQVRARGLRALVQSINYYRLQRCDMDAKVLDCIGRQLLAGSRDLDRCNRVGSYLVVLRGAAGSDNSRGVFLCSDEKKKP